MNIDVVIPLRQRMIEDMTARKLSAGTQRLYYGLLASRKRAGISRVLANCLRPR
jgi:hypothetical protein